MGSFSIWHWIIFGAMIWLAIRAVSGASGGKAASMFCTTCGNEGNGKSNTRGSILIEIVLWLCFIIPGVIYSLWRLTTRARVCAACGATTLVPVNSPIAQKMRKELEKPAAP